MRAALLLLPVAAARNVKASVGVCYTRNQVGWREPKEKKGETNVEVSEGDMRNLVLSAASLKLRHNVSTCLFTDLNASLVSEGIDRVLSSPGGGWVRALVTGARAEGRRPRRRLSGVGRLCRNNFGERSTLQVETVGLFDVLLPDSRDAVVGALPEKARRWAETQGSLVNSRARGAGAKRRGAFETRRFAIRAARA